MNAQPQKWYAHWWVGVAALLLGLLVGWLLRAYCYADGESGLNL